MKKTRILAVILVVTLIAAAVSLYSCGEKDKSILGSGKTTFTLEILDKDSNLKTYTINTNEKTLGDALVKVKLTKDTGYISTLDGITADYDVDEGWWGVSRNGEILNVGAFDEEIEAGAVYSFVYNIGMGDWDGGDDMDNMDDDGPKG